MAIANQERVGKALDLLENGLGPFVGRKFRSLHGDAALERAPAHGRPFE